MESVKETLLKEITRLWQEIAANGNNEFHATNVVLLAKIREHEEIIRSLK